MTLDIRSMSEKFKEILDNITDEELNEAFPPDTTPKGWLSIEDHLPMFMGNDIMRGYSEYKVKDKDGKEFKTCVTDHMIWYYEAKEIGITHWFND